MSPWGRRTADRSVKRTWDIVAYIRRWQDCPRLTFATAERRRRRRRACLPADAMRGMPRRLGEGVVAMSLNNAIFHEFASDGFIYHAIAKGRPGTPMPG